jgi:hypothetical protein
MTLALHRRRWFRAVQVSPTRKYTSFCEAVCTSTASITSVQIGAAMAQRAEHEHTTSPV